MITLEDAAKAMLAAVSEHFTSDGKIERSALLLRGAAIEVLPAKGRDAESFAALVRAEVDAGKPDAIAMVGEAWASVASSPRPREAVVVYLETAGRSAEYVVPIVRDGLFPMLDAAIEVAPTSEIRGFFAR